MTSVSYESSLSKEIITFYDLYRNNSIKKEKTNTLECMFLGEATVSEWIWVCMFLGEATVSEWIWVRFYRIKSSPLQTLVQYEYIRFVGVIQSVFGNFLSVVQFVVFSFRI